MKEIQDKLVHFENLDMQMEKEWQQLEQMKNMLFVDQLTLLFHRSSAPKTDERMEQKSVRIDWYSKIHEYLYTYPLFLLVIYLLTENAIFFPHAC